MPKATYIYWQNRFDRENPDKELEEKILELHKHNKDYEVDAKDHMIMHKLYLDPWKYIQQLIKNADRQGASGLSVCGLLIAAISRRQERAFLIGNR